VPDTQPPVKYLPSPLSVSAHNVTGYLCDALNKSFYNEGTQQFN